MNAARLPTDKEFSQLNNFFFICYGQVLWKYFPTKLLKAETACHGQMLLTQNWDPNLWIIALVFWELSRWLF